MSTITLGYNAAGNPVPLFLNRANRHGLVTGATGTGKSRTLQVMAEGFSRAGIPVFAADIKGDLSGIGSRGQEGGEISDRAAALGYDRQPSSFPVRFWDLMGERGLPMRTSLHDMGRLLVANMLELSDAQDRAVGGVFKWVKDSQSAEGFEDMMPPVLSLDMLRIYLSEISDADDDTRQRYGGATKASAGAILGKIERIEAQGGEALFGEPALDIEDLLAVAPDGRGYVNLLDATELMERPRLYGTWLTFLLMRLFRQLPEVGDIDKPKMVFFFDEAHLLFKNASVELLEEVERLVRLIRSRGVGVYFVTQSPLDVPAPVLAQLGNRVQHALRAFTPKDAAAVKRIAQTYRQNPGVNCVAAITEMQVGEALVSTLQPDGTPLPVERVRVVPPAAHMGPITDLEHDAICSNDPLRHKYATALTGIEAEWSLWERVSAVSYQRFHARRGAWLKQCAERAGAETAPEQMGVIASGVEWAKDRLGWC